MTTSQLSHINERSASDDARHRRTRSTRYHAGCDVPRPVAHSGRVILMEYAGDADGAAQTLNAMDLEKDECERVFDVLMRNIELMMACDVSHVDLSSFNVLYRA